LACNGCMLQYEKTAFLYLHHSAFLCSIYRCVCRSCWQRGGTSPSHLQTSATTPPSFNRYGGPWWDVSRWNLMENILSTYYGCSLSAVTHNKNVFRTHVHIDFFLLLLCGTWDQSLASPFSWHELFSPAPTLWSWVRIPLRHGCLCVFCVRFFCFYSLKWDSQPT
jgi:hypothetical protein